MAIQISGTDVVDNNRKGIFQSANVGAFANPARPGSASTGDLIYSTTDEELQVWDGTQWVSVGGVTEVSATGGNVITPSTNPVGMAYTTHIFTGPGTFTLNQDADVQILVVAGGGAGGVGERFQTPAGIFYRSGGGGGAGGVRWYEGPISSGSYTVTVGAGGGNQYYTTPSENVVAARATPGSPSTFSNPGFSLVATGGGPGGSITNPVPFRNGVPGGSGGGGYHQAPVGGGTGGVGGSIGNDGASAVTLPSPPLTASNVQGGRGGFALPGTNGFEIQASAYFHDLSNGYNFAVSGVANPHTNSSYKLNTWAGGGGPQGSGSPIPSGNRVPGGAGLTIFSYLPNPQGGGFSPAVPGYQYTGGGGGGIVVNNTTLPSPAPGAGVVLSNTISTGGSGIVIIGYYFKQLN